MIIWTDLFTHYISYDELGNGTGKPQQYLFEMFCQHDTAQEEANLSEWLGSVGAKPHQYTLTSSSYFVRLHVYDETLAMLAKLRYL